MINEREIFTPETVNYMHSKLVEGTVRFLQPRNGTDYSTSHFRAERERIAVNVHLGNPPLEGVR